MNIKEMDKLTLSGETLHTIKVMLEKIEVAKTATGKKYLNMTFRDKSGTIFVKKWDSDEETKKEFIINGIYEVKDLEGKLYNGQPNYTIKNSTRLIHLPDEVVLNYCNDFTPNIAELQNTARHYLKMLKGEYRAILDEAFKELNASEDFFIWPAAEGMHHEKASGLAFHTTTMLKLADVISDIYPDVNKQLLICATYLHDFFKLVEYEINEDGSAKLTDAALEGGHIGLCAEFIRDCEKKGIVSRETSKLLRHMILSHHGEYGPALPSTLEAMLLHYIDMIDSRSYMFRAGVAEMEPGEFGTKKHFGTGSRLYKPNLEGTE